MKQLSSFIWIAGVITWCTSMVDSGSDHLEHFDVSDKRGYGIFPKQSAI